jgi:Rrf2 family protein
VVVRRLIAALSKAGLVKSHRGIKGGTTLARPAEAISLLDISKAVGAEGDITTHNQPPNQACPVGANIVGVLLAVLERAEAAKERELAKVSLADLAGQVSSVPHSDG